MTIPIINLLFVTNLLNENSSFLQYSNEGDDDSHEAEENDNYDGDF